MRRVRLSKTFQRNLQGLLAFGAEKFGVVVAADKRARVERLIVSTLVRYPGIGRFEEALRVYSIPVTRTPFILLYDFDDAELRVHMIVHGRADRSRLDPADVDW